MEVVDADDLVSPYFLKGMHNVRACHIQSVGSQVKKKKMLTADDEDTFVSNMVQCPMRETGKVAEVEQILERHLCSRFEHAMEDTVMGL